MTEYLNITYKVWKLLVQNHNWQTYSRPDGYSYDIWSGNRDRVYTSRVNEEEVDDWNYVFDGYTIGVEREDDAIAQIVGLSGLKEKPLSSDGTPVVSKHQLNLGRSSFKRVDNGTEIMNVNGLPSGSAINLWNGSSDAGTDWTHSGEGSESGSAANFGSVGLDTGNANNNNQTLFNNGSAIDINGLYNVVSFFIQPKTYNASSNLAIQWRDESNNLVGSSLDVENYTSNMDLDVWQKVSIPIADFALISNVQYLRFLYTGPVQRHFFDDIQLTSSIGGPYFFRTSSPSGFIYHIEKAVLVISTPDSNWDSYSFANIPELLNGLLLRHYNINTQKVYGSFNVKTNLELFGQFNAEVSNFSNGDVIACFSLDPDLSSVILIDDDDVLEFVVRDDLSSLSSLRAFIHYGVEVTSG